MAPDSKICSTNFSHNSLPEDSGENGSRERWWCRRYSPSLHRVFSPSLDAEKNWYASNERLRCGKPSVFCCTDAAKVFSNEFKQLPCNDVFRQDGAPAPMSWFSADGRRCEFVYVCPLFGLMLGILRQKFLRQVPFILKGQTNFKRWSSG